MGDEVSTPHPDPLDLSLDQFNALMAELGVPPLNTDQWDAMVAE